LERLADLIRPALSWRPGGTSERPAGAMADGRGFIVTPAMTSLLGASGEDIAMILRGLGYRSEMRPRPPEPVAVPVVEAVEAEPAPAVEIAAETTEGGTPESPAPTPDVPPEAPPAPPVEDPQPSDPPAEEPPAEEPPLREPPAETPPVEEPPVEEPQHIPPGPTPGEIQASAEESDDGSQPELVSANGAAEPEAPAEPDMIEVWRPAPAGGRRNEARGPRRRSDARNATGDVTAAPQVGEERHERADRPDRSDQSGRPPRPDRPDRAPRPDRPPRKGRPRHERNESDERRPRPSHRRDEGAQHRSDQAPRPQRERPADPDSPFAALAALKREMEKSKGE
jgi:ATP-dependent RNA helicase SUPV3L1/SUV3